jgi:hypothetical protein
MASERRVRAPMTKETVSIEKPNPQRKRERAHTEIEEGEDTIQKLLLLFVI